MALAALESARHLVLADDDWLLVKRKWPAEKDGSMPVLVERTIAPGERRTELRIADRYESSAETARRASAIAKIPVRRKLPPQA